MQRLILASSNPGKLAELGELLTPSGWQVEVKPADLEIEETGLTFRANAHLKALGVARATGEWALADDSGLEVRVLAGAPGVYSARYGATDSERIARLLTAMQGKSDRAARFVCVVALASPTAIVLDAEGTCEGEVLDAPRGSAGFGYDPIFWIRSLDKTFAELEIEEKQAHSHRGRAVRRLIDEMRRLGLPLAQNS